MRELERDSAKMKQENLDLATEIAHLKSDLNPSLTYDQQKQSLENLRLESRNSKLCEKISKLVDIVEAQNLKLKLVTSEASGGGESIKTQKNLVTQTSTVQTQQTNNHHTHHNQKTGQLRGPGTGTLSQSQRLQNPKKTFGQASSPVSHGSRVTESRGRLGMKYNYSSHGFRGASAGSSTGPIKANKAYAMKY